MAGVGAASHARWGFPRSPVGRRGLHEDAVEGFRDYVAQALERADAERASLIAEIDRLHQYIRTQWACHRPSGRAGARPPRDHAVSGALGRRCTRWDGLADVVRRDGLVDLPASPAARRWRCWPAPRRSPTSGSPRRRRGWRTPIVRMAEAERLVESAEKRASLAREQARQCMAEADEAIQQRWERAEQGDGGPSGDGESRDQLPAGLGRGRRPCA